MYFTPGSNTYVLSAGSLQEAASVAQEGGCVSTRYLGSLYRAAGGYHGGLHAPHQFCHAGCLGRCAGPAESVYMYVSCDWDIKAQVLHVTDASVLLEHTRVALVLQWRTLYCKNDMFYDKRFFGGSTANATYDCSVLLAETICMSVTFPAGFMPGMQGLT